MLRIPATAHSFSGFHRWLFSGGVPEKLKVHFINGDIFIDLGEEMLRVPPDVHTLAGFRRWVFSDDFPEKLKIHYINGNIWTDMTKESIQSHILVKAAVFETLRRLMCEMDLGEFFPDGVLLTNRKAKISNDPDGVAVTWQAVDRKRVRFHKNKDSELEIQGTPDWVMEIVSTSSVTKDTKQLRRAYHKAGIREYWLIDARGEEIKFQILGWRKAGYVQLSVEDGWHQSRVFDHEFRLVRWRIDVRRGTTCLRCGKSRHDRGTT